MVARTQENSRQESGPGRKYGCREYSLEMQLYQLNKKIQRQDLKEDEKNRIVKRIAEIEEILDF
jgi:hypothetical protein